MGKKINKKYERLKLCIDERKFEIGLFWQRSLFFAGIISAAFIAFYWTLGKSTNLSLVISCFGWVSSFAWFLVNRGNKYWQENWEKKVEKYESYIFDEMTFTSGEEEQKKVWILQSKRFSPSRLAIALSLYIFICWTSLIFYLFIKHFTVLDINKEWAGFLFIIFSFLYIGIIYVFCQTEKNKSERY